MIFRQFLETVQNEPVFEPALLLAGNVDPANINLQLSRWLESGRILQLRRGLYALAPPYQRIRPHPFLVANRLSRGSYVSLQSALAYHGIIPEAVFVTTSVSTGRPVRRETPLGVYDFRHLKPQLMYGYRQLDLGEGQSAYVARPEKALLDLVYLEAGGDRLEYIDSLRLQNPEQLDLDLLQGLADRSQSPKLRRAAKVIQKIIMDSNQEYETL